MSIEAPSVDKEDIVVGGTKPARASRAGSAQSIFALPLS